MGTTAPLWKDVTKHHEAFGQRVDNIKPSNWIRKRAYKRACQRAVGQGFTKYRGRICSSTQLLAKGTTHKQQPQQDRQIRHTKTSRAPRLQILSLNLEGLNSGMLDELRLYANRSNFPIPCFQETKWQFELEWQDENWYYIHSGSQQEGPKQGGLLTMVRKSVCVRLECAHIIPGRILQVRLYQRDGACDCINAYNYVRRMPTPPVEDHPSGRHCLLPSPKSR